MSGETAAREAVITALWEADEGAGWNMSVETRAEYEAQADAVLALFVPAGQGWCPVHGTALCPEEYMLFQDGRIAPGYSQFWSEDIRCGQRQPTYRVEHPGRSGQS